MAVLSYLKIRPSTNNEDKEYVKIHIMKIPRFYNTVTKSIHSLRKKGVGETDGETDAVSFYHFQFLWWKDLSSECGQLV